MKNFWSFLLCLLLVALLVPSIAARRVAAADAATAPSATATPEDDDDEDEEEEDADDEDEGDDDDNGDDEEEADEVEAEGKAKEEKTEEKATDEKDEKADEKKSDRKTHTVKAGPLKIQLEADGAFVSREMSPVEIDPEAWSSFEIVDIVEHGTTVHKGQTLIKFDDEDLKDTIEELELDQKINELSIIKAEQELPRLEKSIDMAYEQAERSLDEAETDYKNYQDVDRDIILRSIDLSLKRAEQMAENAHEELDQLEKMYDADDLTEETEEIVLKRQRAAVEQADFALERAKLSHERSLELLLPRNDIEEKETLERVKLSYQRAKTSSETDLNRARYELEKAKRARADSLEKHAKLTSDLSLLEIKAPADGVVYYGSCTDGEWSDMASLIEKLKPENKAPTGQTLMTVVAADDLYVQSKLKESDVPDVEEGQKATVVPTASSDNKLDAKVSKVSSIPVAQGKFSLELELTGSDHPSWLVAGMSGKVKITTYETDDALLVPKKAVHSEEGDEDSKYVWLVDGDEVEKQAVKVGKTKGDDMEIVDGLDEGDVVSLDDEKADDEKTDEKD